MNTTAKLAAIGSLIFVLWLTADSPKKKSEPVVPMTAEKIVLNHNETLVKDTGAKKSGTSPQRQVGTPLLNSPHQFHLSGCEWLDCNTANTGTMKIDTQQIGALKPQDSWTTAIWDLFFSEMRPPGSDCDEFGCGGNHNETLVKDSSTPRNLLRIHEAMLYNHGQSRQLDCEWLDCATNSTATLKINTQIARPTSTDASWMSGVWEFFLGGMKPPGSDCDEFGCGTNHNERLEHYDH